MRIDAYRFWRRLSKGRPLHLLGFALRALLGIVIFVMASNRFAFRVNGEPWRTRTLWAIFVVSMMPAARFLAVGGRAVTLPLALICAAIAAFRVRESRKNRELRCPTTGSSTSADSGGSYDSEAPSWSFSSFFLKETTRTLRVTTHHIDDGGRFGSLKIAFLTDLHFGRPQVPDSFFREVLEAVAVGRPDLIIIGGDLIFKSENLEGGLSFLEALDAPLGVLGILGNHDYAEGADHASDLLGRAGIERISGREKVFAVSRGSLPPWSAPEAFGTALKEVPTEDVFVVSGHEAPWGPDLKGFSAGGSQRPGSGAKHRVPRIAVSHTPDNVYRLEAMGADLVLSGHFHGGQIRLPIVGSVFVPSIFGDRFDRGLFRVGHCHLVVSSGLGVSGPPMRINCPPEVVFVEFGGSPNRLCH